VVKDKEFSAIKNAALFLKIPFTTFFTVLRQPFSFAGNINKNYKSRFKVSGFMLQ